MLINLKTTLNKQKTIRNHMIFRISYNLELLGFPDDNVPSLLHAKTQLKSLIHGSENIKS